MTLLHEPDFGTPAKTGPQVTVTIDDTAVQVSASNGPSEWQEEYRHHSEIARRILPPAAE